MAKEAVEFAGKSYSKESVWKSVNQPLAKATTKYLSDIGGLSPRDQYIERSKELSQAGVANPDKVAFDEVEKRLGFDPLSDAENAKHKKLSKQMVQKLVGPLAGTKAVIGTVGGEPDMVDEIAGAREVLGSLVGKNGPTIPHVNVSQYGKMAYQPSTKTMLLDPGGEPKSIVHEMSHAIEYQNPGVHEASRGFLAERARKHGIEKDAGGRLFVKGFPFKYSGRFYGAKRGTELISTGVEQMALNPAKFAKDDPEHFAFMIAVLRGDFNKGEK
jgi:hypothetical protein